MPDRGLRWPVLRRHLHNQIVFEIEPTLDLRTEKGGIIQVPFLFDTGTQFTTMSISMAQDLDIPFDKNRPIILRGTTGTGKGFFATLRFSFPSLPNFQFESLCCFTMYSLKRPLLSLTDIISHFTFRTMRPSQLHPLGSLILRLHKRDKGQYRD